MQYSQISQVPAFPGQPLSHSTEVHGLCALLTRVQTTTHALTQLGDRSRLSRLCVCVFVCRSLESHLPRVAVTA